MTYYTLFITPLGQITLMSDGIVITSLEFSTQRDGDIEEDVTMQRNDLLPVFTHTQKWLLNYFKGVMPTVSFPPLLAEGTKFQKQVWDILLTISHGDLMTYGAIAKLIEQKSKSKMSAQAVGGAVGSNPISILIPCHRVIGSNHSLTGYSGGLNIKKALLEIEGHSLNDFKE